MPQTLQNKMQELRHHFHQNPETAFKEKNTAKIITHALREIGFSHKNIHEGLAGTGVVATLECNRKVGTPTIALRSDMDALRIDEQNTFDHKSKTPGVMHACGHDGHMAMLMGAAELLFHKKDKLHGTIYFVFQPAEENEAGAKKMIEDGFFTKFPCDEIYGLHNYPGLKEGVFSLHEGPIMASFDTFNITINGKGGHAAYPQDTIDPIPVAAQIITALQNIVSRSNPQQPSVLSVTQMQAGSAYNIIPDSADFCGTVRTLNSKEKKRIEKEILQITTGIAKSFGAQANIRYMYGYPVTINSPKPTQKALRVIQKTFGAKNLTTNNDPSMGSEDFSFFAQKCPACYVRLGAGPIEKGRGLHNSSYDFNDRLLPIGARYWVELASSLLTKTKSSRT